TLTTLGYGDITPQTLGAGALCQMEAIVGQFFTAVIVAWLVGNIITEKQTKS
ncbi:MAG: two pore domain potassium channel family protein, partial [Desulfobulbaceae bacterium]|nr:two pore domain potassium channel family protein [Desulfobulbaceae bacterium]